MCVGSTFAGYGLLIIYAGTTISLIALCVVDALTAAAIKDVVIEVKASCGDHHLGADFDNQSHKNLRKNTKKIFHKMKVLCID